MNKKECALAIKRVLQARGLWDDADLNKALHVREEVTKALKEAGVDPIEMRSYNLGAPISTFEAAIIVPQGIEDALNEQEPGKKPRRGGRS